MRVVKYTSRFWRNYKRERSGQHGKRLDAMLLETVNMLADDKPLPRRHFDHPSAANGRITATATVNGMRELIS
jgi:mRNA interferase YafQ